MAHELNWSGAFYESLAGSINRMTRGGPIGMAAGAIGEASAAMRGMNIPWQGPRTAASLAAAVGGGFVLLNAGRGAVEAVNAAGQGDYGSALANAAIGVGWYAGGRLALGTLARQLPVEAGALAAYEKAAEANFAREDPARYQQVISRYKKEQDMAQAAVDSAAVANSNSVNPKTAQAAAEDGAAMAAEVAGRPTAQPSAVTAVVTPPPKVPLPLPPPRSNGGSGQPFVGTKPGPPPVITSQPQVGTPRDPGMARRFFSGAGRFFSGAARTTGRFLLATGGAAGRAFIPAARVAGGLFSAGRRRLSSGWQSAERWATMLAAASKFRGLGF